MINNFTDLKLNYLKYLYETYGDFRVHFISKYDPNLKNWITDKMYSQCSEKELLQCNLRMQMSNEVFFDTESEKEFNDFLIKIKKNKINLNCGVWDTGSRGYHIPITFLELKDFDEETRTKIREILISFYETDLSKKSGWVAIEYAKHFKTGKEKTLFKEGVNKDNKIPKFVWSRVEEQQKRIEKLLKFKIDNKWIKTDPLLHYVLNNKLKSGFNRNNIVLKNLVCGAVASGLNESEIKRLGESIIENMPHKKIGEWLGWIKKVKKDGMQFNPIEINKWIQKHNLAIEKYELYAKRELEIIDVPEHILKILKDPNLLEIIINEVHKKCIGENSSIKTVLGITCGRLVENKKPESDNLIINDLSGSGKDVLSSAIFDLIPVTEKVEIKRTSPKAISRLENRKLDPKATWIKKALRLEDVSNAVLNDDSLKPLLSNRGLFNQQIIINNFPVQIEIEAKPSIIMTSASADLRDEQIRRMPMMEIDSSKQQTDKVMDFIAEDQNLEYNPQILDCFKYLRRVKVRTPTEFLKQIKKYFPADNVLMRTIFARFRDYIKFSTAFFQYQRQIDEESYYLPNLEIDYTLARLMIIKTTCNSLMIPLNKDQKEMLKRFKGLPSREIQLKPDEDFVDNKKIKIPKTINSNAYSLNELQEIFKEFNERTLRRHLDKLVRYGFLDKINEKRELGRINSKVFCYKYLPVDNFSIPNYKEIVSNMSEVEFMSLMSSMSNMENKPSITKKPINDINDMRDINASDTKVKKDSKKLDYGDDFL